MRSETSDTSYVYWAEMPDSASALAGWLQQGLRQHAERILHQRAEITLQGAIPLLGVQRARLREAGLTLGLDAVKAALLAAGLQATDRACLGVSLALLPLLVLQLLRPTYPSKLATHFAWAHVLAHAHGRSTWGT